MSVKQDVNPNFDLSQGTSLLTDGLCGDNTIKG